jgi:hypothetical protein
MNKKRDKKLIKYLDHISQMSPRSKTYDTIEEFIADLDNPNPEWFCPQCRSRVYEPDEQCKSCGNKLDWDIKQDGDT